MIVVPELCADKNVLPSDPSFLDHRPHCFAHVFFIAVAFGAIELTEARLQRGPRCLFGCDRVGNQRAKTERRNLIGAVVKRYLCIAKAVGVTHKTITPEFPFSTLCTVAQADLPRSPQSLSCVKARLKAASESLSYSTNSTRSSEVVPCRWSRTSVSISRAQRSSGKPAIPVPIAGNAIDRSPCSSAHSRALRVASRRPCSEVCPPSCILAA